MPNFLAWWYAGVPILLAAFMPSIGLLATGCLYCVISTSIFFWLYVRKEENQQQLSPYPPCLLCSLPTNAFPSPNLHLFSWQQQLPVSGKQAGQNDKQYTLCMTPLLVVIGELRVDGCFA